MELVIVDKLLTLGGQHVKKLSFVMIVIVGLLLVGCKNNEESNNEQENQHPEQNNTAEQQESEKKEADINNGGQSTGESDIDEEEDTTVEEEEMKAPTEPLYEIAEDWSVVPLQEGINEKVVLLTIDDAPDQHAVEMAKTLKELDAPAIFFVNGHFIDSEEEQERLKEIYNMGFAIGNHTYNHTNLQSIENDQTKQKEEIVSLNNKIEDILGERPKFFRAPNGSNTDYANGIVEEEGMVLMNWTYGYDYFKPYMDADKLATAMITGEGPEVDVPYSLLKSGANLLMHDREWTAEALAEIVKGLRDQGYEIMDPHLIKTP